MPEDSNANYKHPIRVVARRTGLSPDLIRAWELRYGAVRPIRAPGGQRLYSNAQVERLGLLRCAQQGGRRIGQLANLSLDALERLIEEDLRGEQPRPGVRDERPSGVASQRFLADSLAAVSRMDAEQLESVLRRATVALPASEVIGKVVTPLMSRIGELWWEERLSPGHERLATGVVRRILDGLRVEIQNLDGPAVIVGTPSGQHHEIGALLAAAAAAAQGWRVTYLGPDLPASSIAAAAELTGARAVALSLIYPADDLGLEAELRSLRSLLPAGIALIIGGQAADSYSEVLDDIGAVRLGDLADLSLARVARLTTTNLNGRSSRNHAD